MRSSSPGKLASETACVWMQEPASHGSVNIYNYNGAVASRHVPYSPGHGRLFKKQLLGLHGAGA